MSQYKEILKVETQDSGTVRINRRSRRGHGATYSSGYYPAGWPPGKPLISGRLNYADAKKINHLIKSDRADVAFHWLLRMALEGKTGCKSFREWVSGPTNRMWGSGYLEDCTKYKPIKIVSGGLPS